MSILCFAENPGGANGIITLALEDEAKDNIEIIAQGSAVKYFQDHGLESVPEKEFSANIKALVVGAAHSKDSGSFKYIAKAKELNIPSFTYVDACVNVDMRFKGYSDDPLFHTPDYLFVTEEATCKAYIDIGFHPDKIFIVGNPRYDFVVKRAQLLNKKPRNKKQILFLADPLVPRVGKGFEQSGFGAKSADDVRSYLLLDHIIKNAGANDIIIKLHPRNSYEEFSKYKDKCTIYRGADLGIDLAFQADLVIGTTTSLLAESALIGTPSIAALLTPDERGWLPHILPDNLIISKDEYDLKSSMDQMLSDGYKREEASNKDDLCRDSGKKMVEIITNHCL